MNLEVGQILLNIPSGYLYKVMLRNSVFTWFHYWKDPEMVFRNTWDNNEITDSIFIKLNKAQEYLYG